MAKDYAEDVVHFMCDHRRVEIKVPANIKAYFNEQFVRKTPTEGFKKRYATLRNLMRLAYLQGLSDAKST